MPDVNFDTYRILQQLSSTARFSVTARLSLSSDCNRTIYQKMTSTRKNQSGRIFNADNRPHPYSILILAKFPLDHQITHIGISLSHRRNLRGVRGVRVPPTFWSGGTIPPLFRRMTEKITATFPHPALT